MKSISALATVQIIAVDLAKEVFQLACADANFRIVQSLRLKRVDFLKFWNNLKPVHVVMEACGSAHHFGRWLTSLGHRVSLLPAQYVRAYVRRNKTDAADCAAMLEAVRASDIKIVPVKTQYQGTMMIQGARSVLAHAIKATQLQKPLDALRSWAVKLRERRGFNKAAVGLANKMARIVWATWTQGSAFNGNHSQAQKFAAA